jgi:hypothetical protein
MAGKKDKDWLLDKIQDIKKRKRTLHKLNDPTLKKRLKKELNDEYRSAKRSEKNNLKNILKNYDNLEED